MEQEITLFLSRCHHQRIIAILNNVTIYKSFLSEQVQGAEFGKQGTVFSIRLIHLCTMYSLTVWGFMWSNKKCIIHHGNLKCQKSENGIQQKQFRYLQLS